MNNLLLNRFCEFLEKDGYIDSDWREEKPTALERFTKECDKLKDGTITLSERLRSTNETIFKLNQLSGLNDKSFVDKIVDELIEIELEIEFLEIELSQKTNIISKIYEK